VSLKVLDINYLRAQNTGQGQVIVTSSGLGVTYSPNVYIVNGNVGVGSSTPSKEISVVGNIAVFGPGAGFIFADGSQQTTATSTTPPGGNLGTVQFNNNGSFGGTLSLFWDTTAGRLGVGTNQPKSTLQIKDVGYESTNKNTNDMNPVVLDSFPVPDYRSCHYIVQVTDETYSWFHTTQIMLVHDGLEAFKTEYNIVITANKLGSFDCAINGGNVELSFAAFYSSLKNIKVIRTSIQP
jgi:hypothetical protein